MNRRTWLAAASAAAVAPSIANAQSLTVLDIAYAGSMGSVMEGPLKRRAAADLHLRLHGRAAGADALAHLIAAGSLTPDIFVSVTPEPMLAVLRAGKAERGVPIARTEMVIAYSPKSRFAAQLESNAKGEPNSSPWWQTLEEPGFRFGRTDPQTDPQGRNVIFMFELASRVYRQPDLVQRILGPTMNQQQIFAEPTVMARLQSGELDAASAYRIQPAPFHLPYIRLSPDINLGIASLERDYRQVSLSMLGHTYFPQPLVYYAAVIKGSRHEAQAHAFITWLLQGSGARILDSYAYQPPSGASILNA